MPYEIGTASGHYDLLAKIKAFVTSTAQMGAGNEWGVERDSTGGSDHELILRGPGLSGTEEIYVGMKTYQSVVDDWYNFKLMGATGYSAGDTFELQPGKSNMVGVPLWNQTIPYWLVANGQRIIVAAKVETVYELFYLGKIVPYATPNQYPYPLAIVGMLTSDASTRYSNTAYNMGFKLGDTGALVIRDNSGLWRQSRSWPWKNSWIGGSTESLRDTGGIYPITPIILYETTPNVFGEMDGIFFVSGYNNAVENTMTIGGDTYVMMRNASFTGFQDYVAIKLA